MKSRNVRSRFYSLLLCVGVAATIGVPHPKLLHRKLPTPDTVAAPGSNPSVCVGFNVETNRWGEEWQTCPTGFAAYGVADAGGKPRAGEHIPAVQVCCPLPAPDMLTKEEVFVRESCPEDYVATGSRLDFSKGDDSIQLMRCTKINSARYQLGAPHSSKYWGNGFAGWQGSERIEIEDVPPAIRYAMGRESKDRWGNEGCVGFPWGSLLTSKTGKNCGGFFFRELEFKGAAGDPAAGTPVKMFPDCRDVADVKDPKAGCIG